MKTTLAILTFLIASTMLQAQTDFDHRLRDAVRETRYNNLHNSIIWGARPPNAYFFDQPEGTITYAVRDKKNIFVEARLEIMGTYNTLDRTFLWADHNWSIDSSLSGKVEEFRSQLPAEYQDTMFNSNTELNPQLLALFSQHLGSNGFDIRRYDDAIIYFALMDIKVYRKKKLLQTILPEPHFTLVDNPGLIAIMKEYHAGMDSINVKYTKGEYTDDVAFAEAWQWHLKYWHNETEYWYPALRGGAVYTEEDVWDWQVVRMKDTERLFVVFTMKDLGVNHIAYEINPQAKGTKVIIWKYF